MLVDSCLDAGHVYNYAEGVCASRATALPYVPYTTRHPLIIWGGAMIVLTGLAGAALGRRA
jgi:hypothetical protein